MSHRIDPAEYGTSKHIVEAGYLKDLLRDLEADYYQWARHDQPYQAITPERLAEWTLVHRHCFDGCQGFGSRGFSRDMHADDIERIDALLEKVKRGITDGDSAKYINSELLDEFEQIIDGFAVCNERMVWQ